MLTPVALFGWVPVIVVFFAFLPPRRAVIAAFIVGWLFLPVHSYEIPFFPAYGKVFATCVGVLVGALIFDTQRFLSFRPHWYDIPVVVLCFVSPIATSVINGLGVYDGFSWAFSTTISWAIPYFIGRIYFTDLEGLRELAIGIFLGGLVYAPLIVWEFRMGPQVLRETLYAQMLGPWGWQPTGFLRNSLEVGVWMSTASLLGVGLWFSGSVRQIYGWPMVLLVPVVLITLPLCQTFGAQLLFLAGLALLVFSFKVRSAIGVYALMGAILLFLVLRAPVLWDGQGLIDFAESYFPEKKAGNLRIRVENDNILAEHAMERPLLGWGRFGRNRPEDTRTITDGMWIILWGQRGLVGLASAYAVYLLSVWLLIRRIPLSKWAHPMVAPAVALALSILIRAGDTLFNSQHNPIFIVVVGGLMGLSRIKDNHS